MPRSAPGPVTSVPSRRTRPVVGWSSPAIMRRSVDLPQPEGPGGQRKSLSATRSEVGSLARVGGPPRTPGKVRLSPSMASVGTREDSGEAPGEQPVIQRLEEIIGDQPHHADDHDAEDDLARVEESLAVRDHVPDPARGADELGHDDVGPCPAEHETQRLRDVGRTRGQEHAAHDSARPRAQRVGGLYQVATGRAHRDRDHQHDLEEAPDEDDEELLRLADARPEDEEGNEGGGGQVAGKRHEGLEERLYRLGVPLGMAMGTPSAAARTKPPTTRQTV